MPLRRLDAFVAFAPLCWGGSANGASFAVEGDSDARESQSNFRHCSSASTDFDQSKLLSVPGLLRLLLWGGSEPTPTVAGQQPLYAGTPEDSSGQDAPIAQGQSKTQETATAGLTGKQDAPDLIHPFTVATLPADNASKSVNQNADRSNSPDIEREAKERRRLPIFRSTRLRTMCDLVYWVSVPALLQAGLSVPTRL